MKKTYYFRLGTLCTCFILFMAACKKSDAVAPVAASSIASILKMTGDDQLTAFNMLSSAEKVAIRKLHITKYQRRKNFSDQQNAMINEFLAYNRPEFYDGGSDTREYAITYFAKDWLMRAKSVFKSYEVYTLVFALEDVELTANNSSPHLLDNAKTGEESRKQLNPDRSPYNNESLPNCFCAVGSMFTCPQFGMKYNVATRGYEFSVLYNNCSYAYTQPCDVEGGCGFGGWSTCDGNRCS